MNSSQNSAFFTLFSQTNSKMWPVRFKRANQRLHKRRGSPDICPSLCSNLILSTIVSLFLLYRIIYGDYITTSNIFSQIYNQIFLVNWTVFCYNLLNESLSLDSVKRISDAFSPPEEGRKRASREFQTTISLRCAGIGEKPICHLEQGEITV